MINYIDDKPWPKTGPYKVKRSFPPQFSFLFLFCLSWITLPSSSSCKSRETALSRTTPKTLCFSPTWHTTRTAACARFIKLDWTPPHEQELHLACSALALWILGVALAHRLSVFASGSSTTCSAVIGWPPGVVSSYSTTDPPSVGSTVGHNYGCGLSPAWLLLHQAPPGSSLRLISPGSSCFLPGSFLHRLHPGPC